MESELFRIAQEALTNVRKHAHATHVEVELRTTARGVELSLVDDGVGFEPRPDGEAGHGIVGMRERAKLVGGKLRIAGRSGRGTRLTVLVPSTAEVKR